MQSVPATDQMTKSHPMIAVSRIRPFDNLQAVHATYLDCYPEANRISGSALALSPDDVRLRVFRGYSFAVATINPCSRTSDCLRALLAFSAPAGLSKFTGANPVTISTHLALLKLLPLWMQTADHPPRLTLTQSRITRQERPRYLPTGCKPDGLQQITRIWCASLVTLPILVTRQPYTSTQTTLGCVHPLL